MIEIVKYLALPSTLIIIFFISGVILLLSHKFRRLGEGVLAAAAMIYIIFANGAVSFWLLGSLEYRYPPFKSFKGLKDVDTIVVLSGTAVLDSNLPVSSEVNVSSAFRLIEAMRVLKGLPKGKILISGHDNVPKIMMKLLVSLGVSDEKITIETQSTNTYENAVNVQPILRDRPFILITSAGHMPRAMGVFQKLRMNPVPAPTNYMTQKNFPATSYIPSLLHLWYSDFAVHEYMGIVWYHLTNRM